MTHLLLPFTHGINARAIDAAIVLANHLGVTMLPLSLIHLPNAAEKCHARLGDVEQSIDFLEFVLHKASHAGVPVERLELRTHDPVRSIRGIAQEMECAVLLFIRGKSGVLLSIEEINALLADRSLSFYIMNLPPKRSFFSFLWRPSPAPQECELVEVKVREKGLLFTPEMKGPSPIE